MNDLISRQAAIDRINKQREHLKPDIYPQDKIGDAAYRICAEFIERLPSAQPEDKEACTVCEGLESGDTLYSYSDWDGGIGFDYIRDIKYCPMCGRRLTDE